MATLDEMVSGLAGRYRAARRAEKGRILTEFVEVTGYHRKHPARWLARDDAARPGAAAP